MKRDMDLAREILRRAEEHETPEPMRSFPIEGWTDEQIAYHVELLHEAGLLQAKILKALGGIAEWYILRLTWDGHEYLSTIKSDTVWNKTKNTIKEKGGTLTFEMVKSVATQIMREMVFGNPAGIGS